MPKQSYHFSLGNSSTGPVGFCARIIASSKEEAVRLMKATMPEEHMVVEYLDEVDYFQVYFNPAAISEKDIDEVDDLVEGEHGYEEEEETADSCQP